MAIISITDLLALIQRHGDWDRRGEGPPGSTLTIALRGSGADVNEEAVFNQDLAGQTLTYESRDRTLVLDFDQRGYLVGLEFA